MEKMEATNQIHQTDLLEFIKNLIDSPVSSSDPILQKFLDWATTSPDLLAENCLSLIKSKECSVEYQKISFVILKKQLDYHFLASNLSIETITKISALSLNLFLTPPKDRSICKLNNAILVSLLQNKLYSIKPSKDEKPPTKLVYDSLLFLISKSNTEPPIEKRAQQVQVLQILISADKTGALLSHSTALLCLNELTLNKNPEIRFGVAVILFQIASFPNVEILSNTLQEAVKAMPGFITEELVEKIGVGYEQLFIYFSNWLRFNPTKFFFPLSVLKDTIAAVVAAKIPSTETVEVAESALKFVAEYLHSQRQPENLQANDLKDLMDSLLVLGPRGFSKSSGKIDLDSIVCYEGEAREISVMKSLEVIFRVVAQRKELKEWIESTADKLKYDITRQDKSWMYFGIECLSIVICYLQNVKEVNPYIETLLSFFNDSEDPKAYILSLKACRRVIKMRYVHISQIILKSMIDRANELIMGKKSRLQHDALLILAEMLSQDCIHVNMYKQVIRKTALAIAFEASDTIAQQAIECLLELSKKSKKYFSHELESFIKLAQTLSSTLPHSRISLCLRALQTIIKFKNKIRRDDPQEIKFADQVVELLLGSVNEKVIKDNNYEMFDIVAPTLTEIIMKSQDTKIIASSIPPLMESCKLVIDAIIQKEYVPNPMAEEELSLLPIDNETLQEKASLIKVEKLTQLQADRVNILEASLSSLAKVFYIIDETSMLKQSPFIGTIFQELLTWIRAGYKNNWFYPERITNAFSEFLDAMLVASEWESSLKDKFSDACSKLSDQMLTAKKKETETYKSYFTALRFGFKVMSVRYALDAQKAVDSLHTIVKLIKEILEAYKLTRPSQAQFHVHQEELFPLEIRHLLCVLEGCRLIMEKSDLFAYEITPELIKMTQNLHNLEKPRNFERYVILFSFKHSSKYTNLNDFPELFQYVIKVCQEFVADYCCLMRKLAADCLVIFLKKGGKMFKLQPQQYYNLAVDSLNKTGDAEYAEEYRIARESVIAMIGNIVKYFGSEAGVSCIKLWIEGLPLVSNDEQAEDQHRILYNFILLESEFLLSSKKMTLEFLKAKVAEIDGCTPVENDTLKALAGRVVKKLQILSSNNGPF